MFEWALGILQQIETLIKAAAWVLGIGFILVTYFRTRGQFVATAVAALMAGAMIWAVHNADWFQRKVGEETISHAPAAVAAEADVFHVRWPL